MNMVAGTIFKFMDEKKNEDSKIVFGLEKEKINI